MHLRIGAHTTTRIQQRNGAHLDSLMATSATSQSTGKGAVTKKVLLWLVLLVQICLIGCYWLLQLGFSPSAGQVGSSTASSVAGWISSDNNLVDTKERVNFIKQAVQSKKAIEIEKRKIVQNLNSHRNQNVNNFAKDFFYLQPNRLNKTGGEQEMTMEVVDDANTLWCFREGTLNESTTSNSASGRFNEEDLLLWNFEQHCKCLPGWHGRDCGQPEVMWRALMTAKIPFKLLNPYSDKAHRLVYMLEGNFFSLDLLELQIKAVDAVVDYFIIYYRNVKAKLKELKSLERRLREILVNINYVIFHCSQLKGMRQGNCSTANAYAHFRKRPGQWKSSDLFVYTNDRELLSRRALSFLKYYAVDVRLMRFRLKYNVYGFYWQHPEQTHLSGFISSFVHLDKTPLGNGDPSQLLLHAADVDNGDALVIGDLNHFGGWFCKYCQQPDEIIAELHAESSSLRHVQFPNATRNNYIDAAYLQRLIANGLYVDGKTDLLKLRRYADRYYAPVYAEECSGKFGNLLLNLFESLYEDIEDDGVEY